MTLDFTAAAVSDLQSIRDYPLEAWGADQEQIYLDSLWDGFEQIPREPGGWRFRDDLFPACQIPAQGKHVILFRVQRKVLQVVRILHSAMDYSRHVHKDLDDG